MSNSKYSVTGLKEAKPFAESVYYRTGIARNKLYEAVDEALDEGADKIIIDRVKGKPHKKA